MKKNFLYLPAVAALAVLSFISGCKKADKTAPVISLNGAVSQSLSLQSTYTELGATANDDNDGAITPTVSGTVNVNHTGTYTISYRAIDATGNIATSLRTVTVVNDMAIMTGTYNCTITNVIPIVHYYQAIAASETINNRIVFGRFGNYLHASNVYANITNSTLTLPSQFAIQIDTIPNVADRTFHGSGLKNQTGFSLNYTDSTGITSTNKVETFIKQ